MNRRVILLSLALVALAASMVVLLRSHWMQAKAHEREILAARAAQKRSLLAPAPLDPPRPVTPAEYFDIAARMLFSRDRNPTVIVEVKPPPPKPPLPPLPVYYGQTNLGEPSIILGTAAGASQKSYYAGDKIGEKDKFVIISFDRERITLGFGEDTVEKKLEDLRPKQAPAEQAQAKPGTYAAAPQQPAPARTGSLASAASLADAKPDPKDSIVGADMGSGYHQCVAGDDSPAGTIKDGFKKVISQSMFGKTCHWESVK